MKYLRLTDTAVAPSLVLCVWTAALSITPARRLRVMGAAVCLRARPLPQALLKISSAYLHKKIPQLPEASGEGPEQWSVYLM